MQYNKPTMLQYNKPTMLQYNKPTRLQYNKPTRLQYNKLGYSTSVPLSTGPTDDEDATSL